MTQVDLWEKPQSQKQMRDHQDLFVQKIRDAARAGHKRIVGAASVGFGKTLCSADLLRAGYSKGKVSMFTVPRNALIEPSVEEFEGEGLSDIGIIQQDHPRTNPLAKLQVASIHTAINRELPALDFVIVDEVHLMTELMQALLDSEEWKNKIVIGLSATPWKKGMGLKWTTLIQTKKTAQLIEEGYLVRPRYLVGSEEPKTEGIKTHLDEDGNRVLTERDEAAAMGEQRIIGDIVKTYIKHGEGRPGFYYAVNLAHARQLRDEFEAEGISCGYIDGSMSREARNKVLRAYREARYRVVVNYGVLTTGIDEDVRVLGICRIIKSETDWVQIVGRGLRTDNPRKRVAGMAPKTDCIARDSLVLTQHGQVKIQDITLDHLVWDGVDFVHHDGAICKGIKKVIEHDGIVATPDHKVMTNEGWKSLSEAKSRQSGIIATGSGGQPIRFFDHNFEEDRKCRFSAKSRSALPEMQQDPHGSFLQFFQASNDQGVSALQSKKSNSSTSLALSAVPVSIRSMFKPIEFVLCRLRRTRNKVYVLFSERCISMDRSELGNKGSTLPNRSNRQRRPLLSRKSPMVDRLQEYEQYSKIGWKHEGENHQLQEGPSGNTICRSNPESIDVSRIDGRADNREVLSALGQAKREVWDILNAGSLQRFTVNGKLVHNCLVIDHGGNLTRDDGTALAPAEDIYHDHLDTHDPANKKEKAFSEDDKPATHRKCKKCGGLIPPKTKRCPACGDESMPAFNGKHVDAEFSEFNGQKTAKPKKSEATMFQKQEFYSALLTLMDQRGKAKEWDAHKCEYQAAMRYRDKYQVWPNQLKKERGPVSLEVQLFDKHARIKFAKSKAKESVSA